MQQLSCRMADSHRGIQKPHEDSAACAEVIFQSLRSDWIEYVAVEQILQRPYYVILQHLYMFVFGIGK